MAVPKRRNSTARGRKRRTHWKLFKSQLVNCPNCGSMMKMHNICPECGQYKGREMVSIKKEV